VNGNGAERKEPVKKNILYIHVYLCSREFRGMVRLWGIIHSETVETFQQTRTEEQSSRADKTKQQARRGHSAFS
jgi:hypothetical protein